MIIIAAMDPNRTIGAKGKLPWKKVRGDLTFFKAMTMNHPVIMGRKTYESMGRPLPGRANIVVSRTFKDSDDYYLARDFKGAVGHALAINDRYFVIGGGMIYQEALPYATEMYITHVKATYSGNTQFPEFNEDDWRIYKMFQNKEMTVKRYIKL